MNAQVNNVLNSAQDLRWQVGSDFHEKLVESIYTEAAPDYRRSGNPAGTNEPKTHLIKLSTRSSPAVCLVSLS